MIFMIVPAVIPTSLEHVFATAKRVKPFVREFQVDVVDGLFVPFVSWPYGAGELSGQPKDIRSLCSMFDIEIDLMVDVAEEELPRWIAAGVKRVVIHLESYNDVEAAHALCDEAGVLLGVATLNDTPLSLYLDALEHAQFAQCMGIAKIGSQGQPFDMRVLERIDAVRAKFPQLPIAVDGSVNSDTLLTLRAHGVSRFIVGSALMSSENIGATYAELSELIHT
jgi:pentose-5-phosphate-3-epimerase